MFASMWGANASPNGSAGPSASARDGTFATFLRQMAAVTGLFRTIDDYARAIGKLAEDITQDRWTQRGRQVQMQMRFR
jgi:hypothetical protein